MNFMSLDDGKTLVLTSKVRANLGVVERSTVAGGDPAAEQTDLVQRRRRVHLDIRLGFRRI